MNWTVSGLAEDLRSQVFEFLQSVRRESHESGFSALLAPVDPFNRSDLLTPLVTIAGIIGMLVLSGVAVGALATTLVALLALYFLLTQVFGYELSLAMPATP